MPRSETPGMRLRAARLDRGIAQADLAARVGISASYLNLIEHDKRRIGARLMKDLALLLDLDAEVLVEGSGSALAHQLLAAAQAVTLAGVQTEPPGGFAARYPGWAGIVMRQAARIEALEARVAALSDRLAHDPDMALALHDLVTAVTSIQSTAAILVESDGLDADWQARFHNNLSADAQRLARRTQALSDGLDAITAAPARGPREQMEAFFAARGYHFARIEDGGRPEAELHDAPDMRTRAARALTLQWLHGYAADARALPLARFGAAARSFDYAPLALAADLRAPLSQVLRRLAALPVGQGHPDFGLAVCDAAGGVLFRKPVDGVVLSRAGGACPLWPAFGALARPGQPLDVGVALPGEAAPAFRAVAVSAVIPDDRADAPPRLMATMVLRAAKLDDPFPVGPGCRICPRDNCAARREPQLSRSAE